MGVQKCVYTMHAKQLSKRSIQNQNVIQMIPGLNTERNNAESRQYRKNHAENKLQKIGVIAGAAHRSSHLHTQVNRNCDENSTLDSKLWPMTLSETGVDLWGGRF